MDDRSDPFAPSGSAPTDDVTPAEPGGDERRKEYELRARCAQLRHWCRDQFALDGTEGELPHEVLRELREAEPEMSLDDALEAIRRVARGEPLPPSFTATGGVARLAAERERLRTAFFTLYDAAYPDDCPTEDELLAMIAAGPCRPMSEVLDEIERELEERR